MRDAVRRLIGNKDDKPTTGPLTNIHKDVEILTAALRNLGVRGGPYI
jgi:hypothetical protein